MADLDRIKEIPIVDYAKSMGFTPKKVGRYYTLKEHDSVRIDPRTNLFYRNSTGERGSIIDFAMVFNRQSLNDAIKSLNSLYFGNETYKNTERRQPESVKREERQPLDRRTLRLPERDENMRNVFAYLVKTRCINPGIVKEMVNRNMLYQDTHKNCVFVSYDDTGKAVFGNKRGTNTSHRFVGDCIGCDYGHSFFIGNTKNAENKLIVTESVIDAMSVMDLLERTGADHNDFNYLCLAGTGKYEKAIDYHLNNEKYDRIYLMMDNDEAGAGAAEKLKQHIKEKSGDINVEIKLPDKSTGKDYNDYLKNIKAEENIRIPEKRSIRRQRQRESDYEL